DHDIGLNLALSRDYSLDISTFDHDVIYSSIRNQRYSGSLRLFSQAFVELCSDGSKASFLVFRFLFDAKLTFRRHEGNSLFSYETLYRRVSPLVFKETFEGIAVDASAKDVLRTGKCSTFNE